MFKRYRSAAIAVSALIAISTAAYAAGNYSTYPIVGGAAFCVSTVSGAGGFVTNGNTNNVNPTGQGQATSGSLCAQTVPAGPPIVTGTELIPADTIIGSGANPQTVVLTLASLNALPLTYSTIGITAQTITPASTSGGVFVHSTAVGGTITALTVNLPAAPIDGQQFALSADATVTTLTVQTNSLPNVSTTIKNTPTVLTPSTTGAFGYRFFYNAAGNVWSRLQ